MSLGTFLGFVFLFPFLKWMVVIILPTRLNSRDTKKIRHEHFEKSPPVNLNCTPDYKPLKRLNWPNPCKLFFKRKSSVTISLSFLNNNVILCTLATSCLKFLPNTLLFCCCYLFKFSLHNFEDVQVNIIIKQGYYAKEGQSDMVCVS